MTPTHVDIFDRGRRTWSRDVPLAQAFPEPDERDRVAEAIRSDGYCFCGGLAAPVIVLPAEAPAAGRAA